MKKICIIFLLSIIISLTGLGFLGAQSKTDEVAATAQGEYLRIHIRADSNEAAAQSVKYRVRDQVVEYLTPLVANCNNQAAAFESVNGQLKELAGVATAVLHEQGFPYAATAELANEQFPTRVYEGYTLPAGEYTALIIRLGRGEGDNWWCVVYPPLCFAADTGTNVVYKSKIIEIIEDWKKARKE